MFQTVRLYVREMKLDSEQIHHETLGEAMSANDTLSRLATADSQDDFLVGGGFYETLAHHATDHPSNRRQRGTHPFIHGERLEMLGEHRQRHADALLLQPEYGTADSSPSPIERRATVFRDLRPRDLDGEVMAIVRPSYSGLSVYCSRSGVSAWSTAWLCARAPDRTSCAPSLSRRE